jgi:peptide/nickel transport system substrate-binding protein
VPPGVPRVSSVERKAGSGREFEPSRPRRILAGVRLRRAFAVLASVGLVVGCQSAPIGGDALTAGKPAYGGTLIALIDDDVLDLDPLLSRAVTDREVQYQIYDSLVGIDPSGAIVPRLARPSLSDGGTLITLELRTDVRFHDGTAFDAASVKWNLDRYRTARGSARTSDLAAVEAVEILGPATVRLKLKTPSPGLLAALVDRAGMMVSQRAVEAGGADFTRKPLRAGTGPFVLTEAAKDDQYTLERNPTWWGRDATGGSLPYLDRIVVRTIKNGDVRFTNINTRNAHVTDRVAAKDVATARSDATLRYDERPGFAFRSLIPNRSPGSLFSETRYVKALALAIDRQEIIDRIFSGVGRVGYGAIAPGHLGFDLGFRPYERPDPAGARRLVQEVGRGSLRFELLITAGDPQVQQEAQLLQAQFARADITVDLKALPLAQVIALQDEKKFAVTIFGWSGRIDPDGNTFDQLHTGRPFNFGGYSNPEVDRLLVEQRTTADAAKRRAALRAAEQIYVVDDPARIWYRFGVSQLLTVSSVQGLEPYADSVMRLHTAWFRP